MEPKLSNKWNSPQIVGSFEGTSRLDEPAIRSVNRGVLHDMRYSALLLLVAAVVLQSPVLQGQGHAGTRRHLPGRGELRRRRRRRHRRPGQLRHRAHARRFRGLRKRQAAEDRHVLDGGDSRRKAGRVRLRGPASRGRYADQSKAVRRPRVRDRARRSRRERDAQHAAEGRSQKVRPRVHGRQRPGRGRVYERAEGCGAGIHDQSRASRRGHRQIHRAAHAVAQPGAARLVLPDHRLWLHLAGTTPIRAPELSIRRIPQATAACRTRQSSSGGPARSACSTR